ncbi:MAG: deoxyribodipyrimidine photo-lyase [Candidatus Woesearchaeota archaeon]|nr:MAG: deoxyribodipyrimidine photo-lyase [Candidatus Woesearchaeota archaeon]
MTKKNKKSLFLFRRDLRLEDNTGLISALIDSEQVIPAFIFDNRQSKNNNPFFSTNAFEFMIESLNDLNSQLKAHKKRLFVFEGITEDIISELIDREKIDAVYINKEYTPFGKERDAAIEEACMKNNVSFKCFPDVLLNEPEYVLKPDGSPYIVFTSFWKKASQLPVNKPIKIENHEYTKFYIRNISLEKNIPKYTANPFRMPGGRSNILKIDFSKFKNYASVRDYPSIEGTTKMSAHLKFGTISIREAYWKIVQELTETHSLIRQLYWRDFFYHIAYHFPKVFGKPFNEKFEKIKWEFDEEKFNAWCNGKTGFPIVDAGMRELNTTGYMHNRVRMIVASFLTKDLHIDWRLGEKYFAQKLVDYDPCINNGNWQWSASTGCDAQPYFRIFNPWLQQKKFDPKCEYIKKWVPELRKVDIQTIHNIYDYSIEDYPSPIVDHYVESKKAIKMYNISD